MKKFSRFISVLASALMLAQPILADAEVVGPVEEVAAEDIKYTADLAKLCGYITEDEKKINDDAMACYRSFLDTTAEKYPVDTWRFDFAFIDTDYIPELLMAIPENNVEAEVQIYRYDAENDRVLFVNTLGSCTCLRYKPFADSIYDFELGGEAFRGTVFENSPEVMGLYKMDGTPIYQEDYCARTVYYLTADGYVCETLSEEEFTENHNRFSDIQSCTYFYFDARFDFRSFAYAGTGFEDAQNKLYKVIFDLSGAMSAYTEYLKAFSIIYPDRDIFYTFAYINRDCIPEIIVTVSDETGTEGAVLKGTTTAAAFKNSEVIPLFRLDAYIPTLSYNTATESVSAISMITEGASLGTELFHAVIGGDSTIGEYASYKTLCRSEGEETVTTYLINDTETEQNVYDSYYQPLSGRISAYYTAADLTQYRYCGGEVLDRFARY